MWVVRLNVIAASTWQILHHPPPVLAVSILAITSSTQPAAYCMAITLHRYIHSSINSLSHSNISHYFYINFMSVIGRIQLTKLAIFGMLIYHLNNGLQCSWAVWSRAQYIQFHESQHILNRKAPSNLVSLATRKDQNNFLYIEWD